MLSFGCYERMGLRSLPSNPKRTRRCRRWSSRLARMPSRSMEVSAGGRRRKTPRRRWAVFNVARDEVVALDLALLLRPPGLAIFDCTVGADLIQRLRSWTSKWGSPPMTVRDRPAAKLVVSGRTASRPWVRPPEYAPRP